MTKLDDWLRRSRRHGQPRKAPLKEANEKRRAKYAQRKRQRALGAEPVYCAECGTDLRFGGKRKDAKFCSDACRQAAHRRKVQKAVTGMPKKTKEPLRTNVKSRYEWTKEP